ncbi:MAG: DUF1330 domain-containing protein [Pseudomonadota bacterium]|nr:DUF1330 domain-containing protein [Pseudomonadota bacterium]
MTAYIIVGFTPKDMELLQEYSAKAASTISEFQGEFLAKSISQPMNSKEHPEYQAIISFPTKEKAEGWYLSSQYQGLVSLRDQAMESNFQLVG